MINTNGYDYIYDMTNGWMDEWMDGNNVLLTWRQNSVKCWVILSHSACQESQRWTFRQTDQKHSSVSQVLTRNKPEDIRSDHYQTTENKTNKPSPAFTCWNLQLVSQWWKFCKASSYYSTYISSTIFQAIFLHINHLKWWIFQRFRFHNRDFSKKKFDCYKKNIH